MAWILAKLESLLFLRNCRDIQGGAEIGVRRASVPGIPARIYREVHEIGQTADIFCREIVSLSPAIIYSFATTSFMPFFYDRLMKKSSCVVVFLAILAPFSLAPAGVNPAVDPGRSLTANLDVPVDIEATLRRACFNCHSSETKWPWYSRLPVAGPRIKKDVDDARRVMNFSNWPKRPAPAATLLEASCAALQAGEMPKPPYPLLHPEARLSKEERNRFCQWAQSEARDLTAHK